MGLAQRPKIVVKCVRAKLGCHVLVLGRSRKEVKQIGGVPVEQSHGFDRRAGHLGRNPGDFSRFAQN